MLENKKLRVLSTTEMIASLVNAVGGEHVHNICLIKGELDPHTYEPVKGDAEKLARAQVIFYNGLGLEHGVGLREHLKESPRAYALSDEIPKSSLLENDGVYDPHIWMDMEIWSKTLPYITRILIQHMPENEQYFLERSKQALKSLQLAHKQNRELMLALPSNKRFLVTSHNAFSYFGRAYLSTQEEIDNGSWLNRVEAPEGLAPEGQLSLNDIRELVDHLVRHQIQVLFSESNVNTDSLRKLLDAAQEKGLRVHIAQQPLFGDSMSGPGENLQAYEKMIHHNIEVIISEISEKE